MDQHIPEDALDAEAGSEPRYLLSFIVAADIFEAELLRQFKEALANAPEFALPDHFVVAPAPINRAWFIESLLADLTSLPHQLTFAEPEEEWAARLTNYEAGVADPVEPGGRLHSLTLQIDLDLGGSVDGYLYVREFPDGELVLVSLDFAPEVRARLPRLREVVLAIVERYPVLIATLGFELDALLTEPRSDGVWLKLPLELREIARAAAAVEGKPAYDFIYLGQEAGGGSHPLVLDRIGAPEDGAETVWRGGYRDLDFVGEILRLGELAEQAYTRMYDALRPKDDRDDALFYLARAGDLAGALGLDDIREKIRERSAHIAAVYNAQFRGW